MENYEKQATLNFKVSNAVNVGVAEMAQNAIRRAARKNSNLQVMEVGSFNLKENMRANYGVSYRENEYRDKG